MNSQIITQDNINRIAKFLDTTAGRDRIVG